MEVRSVQSICFSPTGGTKKAVEAVASGMGLGLAQEWDLTLPGAPAPDFGGQEGTVVLIGAPVYAGRVPALAVERLRAVRGAGAAAVLVVSYGNRHYDDTLIELKDLAEEVGFVPVAAAAFVARHSFSSPAMPVAEGRPDSEDVDKAVRFGAAVMDKLRGADAPGGVDVPGNRPYRDGWKQPPMAPEVDEELCETCGACVDVCPAGAISLAPGAVTDGKACIMCGACVQACPSGARDMHIAFIKGLNAKLYEHFSARREPETFL